MSTNQKLRERIWKTPSAPEHRPFPRRFEKWLLTRPTLVVACHLTGAWAEGELLPMEQESWPSSYSLQQPLFFGDTMIEVGLPDRAQLVGGDRGALHLEPVADQEAAVRRALSAASCQPAITRSSAPLLW